jgi:serine/threonine-protein kinase
MGPIRHSRKDIGVRSPITVGAAAFAALGLIGGVGVFAGGSETGVPAPQQIPMSVVATTASIGPQPGSAATVPARTMGTGDDPASPNASADEQKLMGLLPAGYGPDSCQIVTNRPPSAAATVDCWNNSSPGGPAARYLLYPDTKALAASFHNRTLKDITVTPCPNGATSPGNWGYGSGTDVAGEKACGTDSSNSNSAVVTWTENETLMQAVAEGPDLDALYKWWLNPQSPGASQDRSSS